MLYLWNIIIDVQVRCCTFEISHNNRTLDFKAGPNKAPVPLWQPERSLFHR